MKKIIQIILVIVIPEIIIFSIIGIYNPDKVLMPFDNSKIQRVQHDSMPADHAKFEELQQDFETGQQVTEACISCHTERGKEFMKTEHWKWVKTDTTISGEMIELGKENVPNNFCIGISSNEDLCSKCHAGYGYEDKKFDFTDQNNIDCLACHDNTGTYKKGRKGNPVSTVNLSIVAQHVGYPSRDNCGSCHYKGGGGNNVKHGDLDQALNSCSREVDVHMAIDEANMECTECHTTQNHKITGNVYTLSTSNDNRSSCTQCHTATPHKSKTLNQHFEQIACQTCHIPTYAKVNPTKIYWDWSTAGNFIDGKPYHDEEHIAGDSIIEYSSKHGTAIFAKQLAPEYVWFNGNSEIHLFDDKITESPLVLNKLLGNYDDNINPKDIEHPSKIYPVKVMRGKQIYDYNYKTLIQPHTVGPKGSGAYWSDFDWNTSAKTGMEALGLPYSGKYDFVSTESYWLLNHMVSPKEEALSCESCHSRDSRLSALKSFYLPGRDKSKIVDIGGILFLILVVLGVGGHSALRILSKK
ncbi:MAG: tetrathionate reductase family octaheme c-type cytochrome [Bacteroidales bacterium]|nr:tetrathionate reductase family octaheme c-type cytochrome [Bacteroidales bacterium]